MIGIDEASPAPGPNTIHIKLSGKKEDECWLEIERIYHAARELNKNAGTSLMNAAAWPGSPLGIKQSRLPPPS